MIDIQGKDWVVYDIPDEYHVRCPEQWDGWLILKEQTQQEDGSITGVIEKPITKTVENDEGEAVEINDIERLDVRLLQKENEQNADVTIGVTDGVNVHNVGLA